MIPKPCPYCGVFGSVYVSTTIEVNDCNGCGSDETFLVICDFCKGGCGASGPVKDNEKSAVLAWNVRSGQMKGTKKMAIIIEIKRSSDKIYFSLGEGQKMDTVIAVIEAMIPLNQQYQDGYKYVHDDTTKILIHLNEKIYTREEFKVFEKAAAKNISEN
jgi:hypothetical protein